MAEVVTVEYLGRVAVLTIRNERKLGAMTRAQYYELSQKLREVAQHDEVYITVLLGTGRFFSAGADVSVDRSSWQGDENDQRRNLLQTFVAFNLDIAHSFSTHPKVLVVGLNGPVVGLTAALVAHADFIYASPTTYLLTPFSSIGLVAEGASSRALVTRLGVPKAKEALIMSKKITAEELRHTGFVNEILTQQPGRTFRESVLAEVERSLGAHLNGDSMLGIKRLVRGAEADAVDLSNYREVFDGLGRFMSGVPQEEFRKLASGEKRHKL